MGSATAARTKQDKKAFTTVLLNELRRLKEVVGVNTPKVGLYIHGYNNDWQESIDELVDMHAALSKEIGYDPILVGFFWPHQAGPGNISRIARKHATRFQRSSFLR